MRNYSLLLLGGLLIGGCTSAPVTIAVNESRSREDWIKWQSVADQPSIAGTAFDIRALDIRGRAGQEPNVSGVQLTTAALWAIDNNRGVLLKSPGRLDGLQEFDEVTDHGLAYPYAIKAKADRVYVSDNKGIHVFENTTGEQTLLKLFYAVYDFSPTDSGMLAINPIMRAGGSTVVSVDASGGTVARWGPVSTDPLDRRKAAALVTSCGPTVLVALVHAPRAYLLTDDLKLINTIALPYPGSNELHTLESNKGLVNPTAGVYRLPTYVGGALCVDNRYYVVADLPRPWIYEISSEGRLEMIRRATSQEKGAHVVRAAGRRGENGVVDVLALVETEQGRKVLRQFTLH